MQKQLSVLTAFAVILCGTALVRANGGTLLPLDQYQAGTEQVQNTIVNNGGFENVTAGQPDGWTTLNTFQVAAPVGANTSPAVNGNYAAQGPLGSLAQRNGYQQTVALAANTNYILSGYAWNFSPLNYDLVLVELRDSVNPSLVRNFSLAPLDFDPADGVTLIDGSRGVFGYKGFNSGAFFPSGSAVLEVSFEYDATVTGTRPMIAGQIDNVAITPQSLFVEPTRIPEPASLSILGLGAASLLRRRSR